MTPVSLFTCMIDTREVLRRSALRNSSGSTNPPAVHGKTVTSKPAVLFSQSMGAITALCSMAVVMMCFLPLLVAAEARPRIARLLLSVAPLVKMTSSGVVRVIAATYFRASPTARFAFRPYSWVLLLALPHSFTSHLPII